MSAEEQIPTPAADKADAVPVPVPAPAKDTLVEEERSEKILKAKELYSHGSRNFLVKSYAEAADELSEVCVLYEELYGELSDELGMPYLLYAKSLIALALDENKVIDVPDVEDDDNDDDDEEDDGDEEMEGEAAAKTPTNGAAASSSANGNAAKLDAIKEVADDAETTTNSDEADSSTVDKEKENAVSQEMEADPEKTTQETQVSSSADDDAVKKQKNGSTAAGANGNGTATVTDSEKPSTSNGEVAENGVPTGEEVEEEDENEAASSLQLAWEILELAAKIFLRQGISGLPNLAEVQTELANIEFENNILDAAREDYEKALKIYNDLPNNYRRAMAEIHYKIGLTFLMQQLNKEGATSLKEACSLIDDEIAEIKNKADPNEKDKNNIQDMEETKQEIWDKIAEIEETQAQNIAEVRAALDSYIKPMSSQNVDGASCSSSSSVVGAAVAAAASTTNAATSSRPTDISHLIKRKKPDEPTSEAEAAASPAKRPAL